MSFDDLRISSAPINADQNTTAGDGTDPEAAARWERVAQRARQAGLRQGSGPAGPLRLERSEALLIAHDLYMLGEIDHAPSLRWDIATLQSVLSRWDVIIEPDGVPGQGFDDRLRA